MSLRFMFKIIMVSTQHARECYYVTFQYIKWFIPSGNESFGHHLILISRGSCSVFMFIFLRCTIAFLPWHVIANPCGHSHQWILFLFFLYRFSLALQLFSLRDVLAIRSRLCIPIVNVNICIIKWYLKEVVVVQKVCCGDILVLW